MSLKKKSIIGFSAAFIVIIISIVFGRNSLTGSKIHTVKKGVFESAISVKGEIQGKNPILIRIPDDLKERDLRIREFAIKDLIDEGTKVKKGDWIATLDVGSITQRIQENNDDLEMRKADFNDAKIDTTIELTNLREEIKEFKFELEYKELELEQSKYESPAFQRKAKVAYNKTVRQLEKKKRDYELKKMDLRMRLRRIERRYNYYLRRDSLLKKAVVAAEITSPQDGIVMYAKLWGGRKLRVGDEISPWNPNIATIPDLSELISETYVEEIHVTRVEIGDSVEVTIDALPEKVFHGEIYKIANIGQELSGFESKVFNVLIEFVDSDPELKPAMTTNNKIITDHLEDVITIPRECLFSDNVTNYVFIKKSGKVWKKEVITGLENDEWVVIQSGLNEKDKILINAPQKIEEIAYITE